jgi:hypothetical protein
MANPGAPRPRRTPLQALFYWSLVLGVWGLIFIVAFLAVFATGLPDTSTLYTVQRQPSISYLDRSGALVAVRGTQESPPVDIDQLPPLRAGGVRLDRGPAVLPPLRLQPVGHGAGRDLQSQPPRRDAAGRLDHHPAAGPQPVPDPHPEHPPQGPGADPGGVAGNQVLQEAAAGALSQPGEFRRRRLRHRGGRAALFQQARRPADARPGR